jgi:hypothetical protein
MLKETNQLQMKMASLYFNMILRLKIVHQLHQLHQPFWLFTCMYLVINKLYIGKVVNIANRAVGVGGDWLVLVGVNLKHQLFTNWLVLVFMPIGGYGLRLWPLVGVVGVVGREYVYLEIKKVLKCYGVNVKNGLCGL